MLNLYIFAIIRNNNKMNISEKYIKTAVFAALEAGKAILEIYKTKEFDTELKEDQSPLTIADKNAHTVIKEKLSQTGLPVLSEEGKSVPYNERKQWEYLWIVDPLDGTKEFIKGNDEFTVNIALVRDQTPVLGVIYVPVTDVLYAGGEKMGARKIYKAGEQVYNGNFTNWPGEKLPCVKPMIYGVVASRSHMSRKTEEFVNRIKKTKEDIRIISKGSSLKICMVAEGEADVYPRFGPTSEWDTAAGHAIAVASGATVFACNDNENNSDHAGQTTDPECDIKKPLYYNKEDLLNPWFIVKR